MSTCSHADSAADKALRRRSLFQVSIELLVLSATLEIKNCLFQNFIDLLVAFIALIASAEDKVVECNGENDSRSELEIKVITDFDYNANTNLLNVNKLETY